MKNQTNPFRYLATLLVLVALFASSCGSKEGKVEGVNMLYGTDSKVWKTDKELSSTGDKVAQTDAQEDERYTFYANGQFSLASPTRNMAGKYTFDQTANKLTFMPDGASQSMTVDVVTMTDDKLTFKGTDGSEIRLEKE
ncbi:hypothetical protein LRS06_12255 [Hymenobacter sp. J193]|uniref:hypothetical protein n=1 Tax=Hymenobacter sp. J193 TaxID=2898429 RepID=UPI0021509AA2|nr:hypothetical protein [Hymenobacter sp. J193]MCR5888525.1 hypothetical protein [Hymenobacter sp. J193]